MKSLKQKRSHKKLLLLSALVLIVVVCFGVYWKLHHDSTVKPAGGTTQPINYGSATESQKSPGADIKSQSVRDTSTPQANATQNTTPSNGSKQTVTMTIPSTEQLATTYKITSQIYTYTSDGTCTLTLSREGSNPVVLNASIQAQASTSVCEGFSVPLSQLSPGTWQVSLTFENSTLSGGASTTIVVK